MRYVLIISWLLFLKLIFREFFRLKIQKNQVILNVFQRKYFWITSLLNIVLHKHYVKISMTHLLSMHPFSTPWKRQKNLRFSDVFRGQRKGALGTNAIKCGSKIHVLKLFQLSALYSFPQIILRSCRCSLRNLFSGLFHM